MNTTVEAFRKLANAFDQVADALEHNPNAGVKAVTVFDALFPGFGETASLVQPEGLAINQFVSVQNKPVTKASVPKKTKKKHRGRTQRNWANLLRPLSNYGQVVLPTPKGLTNSKWEANIRNSVSYHLKCACNMTCGKDLDGNRFVAVTLRRSDAV